MNQNILRYLREYTYKENDINKLLVSSFLYINEINEVNNVFLREFIINNNDEAEVLRLKRFVSFFDDKFDIELLLELFEFVISPQDKEVNGAVFTPKYIRDYLVKHILDEFRNQEIELYNLKFGDIACGCGGFFKTIADEYRIRLNKSFYDIYRENLYGLDIQDYSVVRTKILLILHAIINGEDREEFVFNLFQGDALEFDWCQIAVLANNGGFDAILGNPPYVGSSNLEKHTKDLMKRWSVSSTGKLDLYIPFFQIGLNFLKEDGILGYITVNNFYRSLNGRALRKFFNDCGYYFKLIDFGNKQVFKTRLTYTCICLIQKSQGNLLYTNVSPNRINSLSDSDFIDFEYDRLNDFDGWQLESINVKTNLYKLENSGKKIGDLFNIKNGFATLRNSIYLFTPYKEDEQFYYFEKKEKKYFVEKNICQNAIKPNILKDESDLKTYQEKIIFPYIIVENNNSDIFQLKVDRSIKIIDEGVFKKNYPNAYDYLLQQKSELARRDKGQREYEFWYAFGRTQALNIVGKKLLFPYISDQPYFVFTNEENLLFYNGYAVVSDSEEDLKFIQKILLTDIFWYYIKYTSKPYANDYYALAKNYIKNFSIPDFTESERKKFMKLTKKASIENFLQKKYDIEL